MIRVECQPGKQLPDGCEFQFHGRLRHAGEEPVLDPGRDVGSPDVADVLDAAIAEPAEQGVGRAGI